MIGDETAKKWFRIMFSKTWVLNLVLAGMLVLFWANIWRVWRSDQGILPEAASIEETKQVKKYSFPENRLLSESEYDLVVENNPFSPDRSSGIKEASSAEVMDQEVKVSGKTIALYGVIILGQNKTALINNPDPNSNDKDYLWVKEGDQVGELTVAGIKDDHILMSGKGLNYSVRLYDPDKVKKDKKKEGQAQQTATPAVIHAGQTAASSESGAGAAGSPAVVAPEKKPAPGGSQPGRSGAVKSEDQEYEIIETPFGEIKRKKR